MVKKGGRSRGDLSFGDYLEQLTEDVHGYCQAIQKWQEKDAGYTQGYPHIYMLSCRARSKRGLKSIEDIELPPQYIDAKKDLVQHFNDAEICLHNIIEQEKEDIERLLSQGSELDERVNMLSSQLIRFRRAFRDRMLFGNDCIEYEELRDLGHDFLLLFSDIAAVIYNPPPTLATWETFNQWGSRIKSLEQLFRDWFGYFEPLKDIFESIRQQEYNIDFWWLTKTPSLEDVEELRISEGHLVALGQLIEQTGAPKSHDAGLAFEYASGNLIGSRLQQIRHHLMTCPSCMEDVIYSRLTMVSSQKPTAQGVPQIILEAIRAGKSGPSYWLGRLLADLKNTLPSLILPTVEEVKAALGDTWCTMVEALLMARLRQEQLPLLAGEKEQIGEYTIYALRIEATGDEIKNAVPIKATISSQVYEKGRLSISGKVELVPEGATGASLWYCCWLRADGRLVRPEPKSFHFNKEKGDFFVSFKAKKIDKGELRLMQMVNSP